VLEHKGLQDRLPLPPEMRIVLPAFPSRPSQGRRLTAPLRCIERFGAHRCMFESNFPLEKMGVGWVTLWNAFKRIAAGASAAEKLALFSGTARRVYQLD
jgi:hypothetical protein